jgi:hypothetical protein
MAEQESAAARNANKHFRKESQARDGALAWKEYIDQEAATRLKTARLRAQRLARDASLVGTADTSPNRVTKASRPKSGVNHS